MLIHQQTKKVVLNLRNPERVTNLIPTAKAFQFKGATLVAVPHRLAETRVLRNMGYEVPSPIRYYYGWSGSNNPFKAQLETCGFLTLNPRAFVLNDMGCVDSETEYLTPTGWRKISQYEGGEVAQYHPETGRIEFVTPDRYVKLPCPEMVRIKTKYGIDQLLSPEHRVLLRRYQKADDTEVVSAAELLARHDAWVSGQKVPRRDGKIPYSKSCIPVTFSVEGGAGLALTDAQLRVQVAVMADGHFANGTTRCVMRLKKLRKIERMRELLDTAGIPYDDKACGSAEGFRVIRFNAPWRVKEFDARFWEASRDQLYLITDEVMRWDGSISQTKPTERFSTLSRASADFVQYAYAATGRTARVMSQERRGKIEYNVQVRHSGGPLLLASNGSDGTHRSVMSVEPSTDGFKYCFMVPSTFLLFRRNGCIFASGNTGKTLSTLWAFDFLREQGLASKALIVSPLSTLESTWADEVFRHFPHLNVAVLYGTKERRLKMLAQDADIYLINHDGMKTIEAELVARRDIDTVVVDEIASFRNASTARWKTLNRVIAGRERVWGLTGTPTPNLPTDAWAQCRLISPERVPKYFSAFKDATMRQLGPFKWLPRDNATDIVADAMQPAIRFKREDCIDLPPCTYISRNVPLTPEQEKAYKQMATQLHMEFGGDEVTAVNEAVKMQKLVQIASGVVYGPDRSEVILPNDPRVGVVDEVIQEAGSKVIVFVPFTGVLNHVAEQLRDKGHDVAVINGATPKADRDRIFRQFQHEKAINVLVAQPAAMSHGLTLTAASVVIWYAPITSNETYLQANARITRPGQKRNQLIVHIQGTEVEKRIYNRLQNKQSMQGLLLDIVRGLT